MKASEVIEKLQELISTYGDLNCLYYSDGGGFGDSPVTMISEDSGDFLIS